MTLPILTVLAALALPTALLAQEEVTVPSAEGATIYADHYPHEGDRSRGTVLLVHDETGNSRDYAEIAPRLAALAFEAVAVDIRPGGQMDGGTNRTVAGLAAAPSFHDDGLQHVQAALAGAREALPDDPILHVGSGPSADMAIVAAAEDPEGIAAVLAVSPLSMLMRSDEAEAASRLTVPPFLTCATVPINELASVSKIADKVPPDLLTRFDPDLGA